MPVNISINNLKHIKKLNFTIPGKGVWLLTGPNGTGKTSLLACMRRIGERNAFPMHFKASAQSNNLDSFAGASIEYAVNGINVNYKYSGTRWEPRPKANASVLRTAGYPGVIYIAADARRIEPRPEDFKPRGVRAANASIIAGANSIFDTQRFNDLNAAKVMVDHLVGKVCHDLYKGLAPHPSVQSVPVGGFVNVLRFFKHQKALVPAITRCFVLLDADAEPSLAIATQPDVIAIRDTERASISYLTVTPEVGLAQYLDQHTADVRNALRIHYNLPGLQLTKADLGALPPALPRKPNKKYVRDACEKLSQRLPNGDSNKVEEVLLKLLANHLFATDRANIMRRMSPLLT